MKAQMFEQSPSRLCRHEKWQKDLSEEWKREPWEKLLSHVVNHWVNREGLIDYLSCKVTKPVRHNLPISSLCRELHNDGIGWTIQQALVLKHTEASREWCERITKPCLRDSPKFPLSKLFSQFLCGEKLNRWGLVSGNKSTLIKVSEIS